MVIIGLDPGTRESGFAVLDPVEWKVEERGVTENRFLLWDKLPYLRGKYGAVPLAVEMVGHYGSGMSVGKDVYHTVLWIGRFVSEWRGPVKLIKRPTVKAQLCGTVKAKDGQVAQALRDLWGGDEKALGNTRCSACNGLGAWGRGKKRAVCLTCNGAKRTPPGPLAGISSHAWQALAAAVAVHQGAEAPTLQELLGC